MKRREDIEAAKAAKLALAEADPNSVEGGKTGSEDLEDLVPVRESENGKEPRDTGK
jgi:hypothetical protein